MSRLAMRALADEPPSRTNEVCFARDGRAVAAIGDGGAVIVDASEPRELLRIPTGRCRGAVVFADQVWWVDGAELLRCDLVGCVIGAPIAVDDEPDARLVPAPLGPNGVVWGRTAFVESAPPAPVVERLDEDTSIERRAVPDADLAIPLPGRRWIYLRRGALELGNGLVATVPPVRYTRAELMFDGAAVALIADREVAIVKRSSGSLHGRIALPGGAVRIAARRGIAAVAVDPRRTELVDLRTGRSAGRLVHARDVAIFAIDGDARRAAVLEADGRLELVELGRQARSRLALGGASSEPACGQLVEPTVGHEPSSEPGPASPALAETPPASPRPVVVEARAVLEAAASPAPVVEALALVEAEASPAPASPAPAVVDARAERGPLRALMPRERGAVAPAVDRRVLDEELRGVGFAAALAIAKAWDSRRIGYANGGQLPFEHEVAAALGVNAGFARAHVAAAERRLAAHRARTRCSSPQLAALRAELGLSALGVDVLLVIAAPSLWGEAARLYGILANDRSRPLVDELLVASVLASRATRAEVARELDAGAPLVASGAVAIAEHGPRPFRALAIDPVVVARLEGSAPDLGGGVELRGACSATRIGALSYPGARLEDALVALARPGPPARVAIHGRAGCGLRALAAALAAEANRDLAVIDAGELPRTVDGFRAAVATALRRAHLAGCLPCLHHLDAVAFERRTGAESIADLVRAHRGPVLACLPPDAATPFGADHTAISVPAPSETDRTRAWTDALRERGWSTAPAPALAARHRIGVAAIRRAITAASDLDELDAAIRRDRDLRIGEHARRIARTADWASLVLPPDVMDSLHELVGRIRHRRRVMEQWGMDRVAATARGVTALLQGAPGTGKTMIAGVIARELGIDLYAVDLSRVMSRWLGETERNLAAIFEAAEDGSCMLLFDEADSLFARRTSVQSSNDRYANLEVNYLLQRLDAFEGIAILTTNFGGAIDPAFKRRLSFKLTLPFPDDDTRERLWRVHLPPELPVDGPLALGALAKKYQLAGGHIRNACLRAAFLAAHDDSALTQAHLERAVTLEFAEVGKLAASGALE